MILKGSDMLQHSMMWYGCGDKSFVNGVYDPEQTFE
jgi:hypothetical protein